MYWSKTAINKTDFFYFTFATYVHTAVIKQKLHVSTATVSSSFFVVSFYYMCASTLTTWHHHRCWQLDHASCTSRPGHEGRPAGSLYHAPRQSSVAPRRHHSGRQSCTSRCTLSTLSTHTVTLMWDSNGLYGIVTLLQQLPLLSGDSYKTKYLAHNIRFATNTVGQLPVFIFFHFKPWHYIAFTLAV